MPPLREIPAHISTRKGSPKKSTPPTPQVDLLIDFEIDGPTVSGGDRLPNPFEIEGSAAVHETRVTLRTEEEQQTAAREREEKERETLEKEVNSRRDARRKSLANRRVSFAPEATLHTWDVVVEYQDSTTSSNATNSTRRASSAAGDLALSPHTGTSNSDPSEPPSTPPEQIEEDTVTASPAHQRDLHQKKRRRSSGIPPMNFNNPDDEGFSSSPFSGSSAGDPEEVLEDDGSLSDSASEDDDGTMMSLDGGETTDMSMASVKSISSDSSGRLEATLRLAAQQAGTQGIEFDERGESDVAEEKDVVASFVPWKKPAQNLESQQDQENVNPFSPAFKAGASLNNEDESDGDEMTMDTTRAIGGIIPSAGQAEEDEMSMDVTRVFGGIISNQAPKLVNSKRKSLPPNRRQSTRRRSSDAGSSLEDETMDLTMAVGGIHPSREETVSMDEDMTMEFTSVVGGVLPQSKPLSKGRRRSSMAPPQKVQNKQRRESMDSSAGDDTMDMTVAIGGIMPSITEATPELDQTMGMEMTTALGGILEPQLSTGNRIRAKKLMELETDLGSSPFQAEVIANSPPKLAAPVHTIASETGSPSMAAFRGKGLRRSAEARTSTTPKSRVSGTPIKKSATPTKQITPKPAKPTTPAKASPSKNAVIRTSSPKKLFQDEIKAASTTPQASASKKTVSPNKSPNKLFQNDQHTGIATPSFVLTPQRRVSSGVGIDRAGLGSPRVAALLDRRGSIGDQARAFVPSQLAEVNSGVRFQDPRSMEEQIDKERAEEEDRENGRKIMEREADQGEDEKDVTINLKEMIQSLTPKKKSLKGRKSLHVGAAKGILGKRPIELDEDEDDEDDMSGVKRLKNHQGSPVKNVKLQAPPSKAETTGRLTRSTRKSMEAASTTPTIAASPAKGRNTTLHGQSRFKDANTNSNDHDMIPFAEKAPIEDPQVNENSFEDDRIQLQDFLNMTSIRFMELTTTKRRHTTAPTPSSTRDNKSDENPSLEDCVAVGAAVIPMLELFQHVSITA